MHNEIQAAERRRKQISAMPSQRITLLKIAGVAAEILTTKLHAWASERVAEDESEWSSEQWPAHAGLEIDALVDNLRTNAVAPPVVAAIEWLDLESLGDMFPQMLTPPGGHSPVVAYGRRFEVYGYELPDGSCLERYVSSAAKRHTAGYGLYARRLLDAAQAYSFIEEPMLLIVAREPVGQMYEPAEVAELSRKRPEWLA